MNEKAMTYTMEGWQTEELLLKNRVKQLEDAFNRYHREADGLQLLELLQKATEHWSQLLPQRSENAEILDPWLQMYIAEERVDQGEAYSWEDIFGKHSALQLCQRYLSHANEMLKRFGGEVYQLAVLQANNMRVRLWMLDHQLNTKYRSWLMEQLNQGLAMAERFAQRAKTPELQLQLAQSHVNHAKTIPQDAWEHLFAAVAILEQLYTDGYTAKLPLAVLYREAAFVPYINTQEEREERYKAAIKLCMNSIQILEELVKEDSCPRHCRELANSYRRLACLHAEISDNTLGCVWLENAIGVQQTLVAEQGCLMDLRTLANDYMRMAILLKAEEVYNQAVDCVDKALELGWKVAVTLGTRESCYQLNNLLHIAHGHFEAETPMEFVEARREELVSLITTQPGIKNRRALSEAYMVEGYFSLIAHSRMPGHSATSEEYAAWKEEQQMAKQYACDCWLKALELLEETMQQESSLWLQRKQAELVEQIVRYGSGADKAADQKFVAGAERSVVLWRAVAEQSDALDDWLSLGQLEGTWLYPALDRLHERNFHRGSGEPFTFLSLEELYRDFSAATGQAPELALEHCRHCMELCEKWVTETDSLESKEALISEYKSMAYLTFPHKTQLYLLLAVPLLEQLEQMTRGSGWGIDEYSRELLRVYDNLSNLCREEGDLTKSELWKKRRDRLQCEIDQREAQDDWEWEQEMADSYDPVTGIYHGGDPDYRREDDLNKEDTED